MIYTYDNRIDTYIVNCIGTRHFNGVQQKAVVLGQYLVIGWIVENKTKQYGFGHGDAVAMLPGFAIIW